MRLNPPDRHVWYPSHSNYDPLQAHDKDQEPKRKWWDRLEEEVRDTQSSLWRVPAYQVKLEWREEWWEVVEGDWLRYESGMSTWWMIVKVAKREWPWEWFSKFWISSLMSKSFRVCTAIRLSSTLTEFSTVNKYLLYLSSTFTIVFHEIDRTVCTVQYCS